MNWEIIVVIVIAVFGWIATYRLSVKAQEKSFRNQILNSARLDITKAIRDYQKWLSRFESLTAEVSYAIILQENGRSINWMETIKKIRDELYSDPSFMNWVMYLEEYELLFTVTPECRHQLLKRHNQVNEVIHSFVKELISAGFKPEALEIRKKALKEADKNLPIRIGQLVLMEDLLIYLQNYSLSSITGKRKPEREPKDPSLPRLYTDKKGYLQFRERSNMFNLRYYCQGEGDEGILKLLVDIEAKYGIAHETLNLSTNGAYDEGKEKIVYKRDFKPRAKLLKKRTHESITRLRSRKGRYFVSRPGTIAIVRNDKIEWYTLGVEEIIEFLKDVFDKGYAFLEKLCKNPD